MSSLHDLLVSDLNSRDLSGEGEQSVQVSEIDLDFVEKVAQSVEDVLEKLAGIVADPETSDAVDVRQYLLQKVAQAKEAKVADANEQDTEDLRSVVLHKLAHLTPEVAVEAENQETADADNQIKATLESWVAKVKEAKVEDVADPTSPAAMKSVFDLMGGTHE